MRRRPVRFLTSLALCALALAACGSVSAATALQNWVNGAQLDANTARLTLDARHSLTALADPHSTSAQLHTVCAVLDLETLQANSALPSPDAQVTALLSSAYTSLGDAANVCYHAATSVGKRRDAQVYLHRAGADLSEALARVSALGS